MKHCMMIARSQDCFVLYRNWSRLFTWNLMTWLGSSLAGLCDVEKLDVENLSVWCWEPSTLSSVSKCTSAVSSHKPLTHDLKVARVLMQARQVSPSMMAHCLRFVIVGRRSLIDLRRKLICDSSMRARVGQLSFYCSDSSQYDQAHCLANPTAVADLLFLSIARTFSMIISRRPLDLCQDWKNIPVDL